MNNTNGHAILKSTKDVDNKVLPHQVSDISASEEQIKKIAHHFREIMFTLGLDLMDDSLKDTPERFAKMYVNEIFSGLKPQNHPAISLFENKYGYNEMLIEKNITLFSMCEHHFIPFTGKVHVGYFAKAKVIGLSKINRLVEYYARRPQVQERLTHQIAGGLMEILATQDIAVVIEATHLCVASRGIRDTNSTTLTAYYSGKFTDPVTKSEFLTLIQ